MVRIHTIALLTTLTLALAGCGGDDGGDGGNGTTTATTTSMNSTTTGSGGGAEPLNLTGQVTGFADCTIATSGGQPPASAHEQTVPAEAWNGTFELTFDSDSPAAELCISWGDGPFSTTLTGMVPDAVARVRVAADLAPTGAAYTISITPVA